MWPRRLPSTSVCSPCESARRGFADSSPSSAGPGTARRSRRPRRSRPNEVVTTRETIRVLCVDDHRLMREGIVRIVGVQPDMTVVAQASDGEQAVEQFLRVRPDVTLMDLEMPTMRGVQAIHAIRRHDPDARIVVLTMYHGDEDIYRAVAAGAVGYLLKDTLPDDLIRVIRDVHA